MSAFPQGKPRTKLRAVGFLVLAPALRQVACSLVSIKVEQLKPILILVAVLLTGCHSRRTYYERPSIEGFRFGAHASLVGGRGDTLKVSATAENISKYPLREERGSCSRVHELAFVADDGSKNWDSKAWEVSRLPVYHDATGRVIPWFCADVLFVRTVPMNGLVSYEVRVPVSEILGDSLSPRKYRITARLPFNGREIKNLRAGDVELRPPTQPPNAYPTGWCDSTPMKPVGRAARIPDAVPVSGLGALTGLVIQAETGDALQSAGVRLVSLSSDPSVSRTERATDSQGGFRFDSLAPGRYQVRVRRLGEYQDSLRIQAIAGRLDTVRIRMRAYRCHGY
jgi:Carboxypeptidase regulatory-like domain